MARTPDDLRDEPRTYYYYSGSQGVDDEVRLRDFPPSQRALNSVKLAKPVRHTPGMLTNSTPSVLPRNLGCLGRRSWLQLPGVLATLTSTNSLLHLLVIVELLLLISACERRFFQCWGRSLASRPESS